MISGLVGTPPRERRVEGFRQAMAMHNVPTEERLIRAGDFTELGGYQATLELLRLEPRPTAIFAANDLMALGAMQALRERGIRIPEDMAVVGFDDIPAASLVHPGLTTISQTPHALGAKSAEILLSRLTGRRSGAGDYAGLPFDLVIRDSS
jgi:LacI family transcriptional regulator